MSVKQRILSAFWAFHLALCVIYILPNGMPAAPSYTWRFVAPYGAYTGAATGYGFFAPNVPRARRIRVRVLCGDQWTFVEAPLEGSESRLRLMTITSLLMQKEMEESVAASWAAFAFGKFPCAQAALVEVDYYMIPTIQEYRQGSRPGWKLRQVLPFSTKDQLKSTEHSTQ